MTSAALWSRLTWRHPPSLTLAGVLFYTNTTWSSFKHRSGPVAPLADNLPGGRPVVTAQPTDPRPSRQPLLLQQEVPPVFLGAIHIALFSESKTGKMWGSASVRPMLLALHSAAHFPLRGIWLREQFPSLGLPGAVFCGSASYVELHSSRPHTSPDGPFFSFRGRTRLPPLLAQHWEMTLPGPYLRIT